MKKSNVYGLATVAALAAIGLSLPVTTYAVDVPDAETDGVAGFSVTEDLQKTPIVKPGTDTIVNPESPLGQKPVVGDVVLSYAPNFSFGTTNKISLGNGTTEYKAKNNTYQYSDDTANTVYEIPQFVQVADASGVNYTKWAVTLQQSGVFSSTTGTGATAVTNTLENSRIRIKGQTTTNNLITSVSDAITGINIPGTDPKYVQVPVKSVASDGGAIQVLSSTGDTNKATGSTNGTKSSVVFKNSYLETDYKTVSTVSDINDRGENEDVVLAVPSTDKVLKQTYSAKLVWTLTVQ